MPRRNNRNRLYRIRNYTPILKQVNETYVLPSGSTTGNILTLIKNGDDSTSNLTVRGFNMSVYAEMLASGSSNALIDNVSFYVMFVPEGYNATINLPFTHPEWLLNYSFQGTPNNDTSPLGYNIRVNSRRSRKLRPGDQIALFTLAETESGVSDQYMVVRGLIKYLSKRN